VDACVQVTTIDIRVKTMGGQLREIQQENKTREAMSVATRLLLLTGTSCWGNGDCLDIIAWSVSIATGTVLYLFLGYDSVDFCHDKITPKLLGTCNK